MWKYAYHEERMRHQDWRDRCNALGEEGWSLCFMRFDDSGRVDCYFKRTISNREQADAAFSLGNPGPDYVPPSFPAPGQQGVGL